MRLLEFGALDLVPPFVLGVREGFPEELIGESDSGSLKWQACENVKTASRTAACSAVQYEATEQYGGTVL